MKRTLIKLSIFSFLFFSSQAAYAQKYWLVIGSYRQGPGAKPAVSGITSPSLYAIPMATIELCKRAGKKISSDIYKPVWNFDNRWTCIKASE